MKSRNWTPFKTLFCQRHSQINVSNQTICMCFTIAGTELPTCSLRDTNATGFTPRVTRLKTEWSMTCLWVPTHFSVEFFFSVGWFSGRFSVCLQKAMEQEEGDEEEERETKPDPLHQLILHFSRTALTEKRFERWNVVKAYQKLLQD